MNPKLKYGLILIAFLLVAGYLIRDIYLSRHDVSENSRVINNLKDSFDKDKNDVIRTKEKIIEFKTNPKAPEKLLRDNYDMIRKDQIIIEDPKDDHDETD